MKRSAVFVSAIAFAVLGFNVTTASQAEAAVCKSSTVSAVGSWSRTYAGARYSARRAWRRKARARFGRAYDKWWWAANKSYGCWQHKNRERCRVKARPCRPGY